MAGEHYNELIDTAIEAHLDGATVPAVQLGYVY